MCGTGMMKALYFFDLEGKYTVISDKLLKRHLVCDIGEKIWYKQQKLERIFFANNLRNLEIF